MRDVSIQLKAFISNAQSQDIMIYAKQPAVQKNHLKCNTCQMLFRDAYSFKRHCTVQSSMCKESMSLSVMCYELVCGRFYPIPTNSNTALNASAMQHPKSTADSAFPTAVIRHSNSTADASSPTALFPITPTTTTQTTPSPINHRISASSASIGTPSTVNFEQYFNDSLPVSCLNKVSLVDMYLKKVVDPMDSIHEWRKVFYPYFVELGEDCESELVRGIEISKNAAKIVAQDAALTRLLLVYECVDENYTAVDAISNRDLTSLLVKFLREESGHVSDPNRFSFRQRVKSKEQVTEFRNLLAFLYEYKCPTLNDFRQQMENPLYSIDEAHKNTVIPRLVYRLATESLPHNNHIIWILRWAYSRCFILVEDKPRLRSANQCSSFFSTAIYIIRQCTMVLTATMRSNVEKQFELVKHVNHSEAVQKLSLHLNETRVISTHHASTSKSLITADGDYIIGNASFKREHYSKLIHNIKTPMWKLMRQIFLGDDWMVCLGSGQFEVRSPLCYAFAHFSVNKSCNMFPLAKYGDKWFFGEIAFTSNEGTVVCLKELELCDTIHPTHNLAQRLDAEFMLLLHGCGGGGERQSTIETMFGSQMRIAGGNIYYYLTHEKQGNIQTVLRDPMGTCCLHQLFHISVSFVQLPPT
eukprot:g6247.t1 g6247   contig23:1094-3019(-)